MNDSAAATHPVIPIVIDPAGTLVVNGVGVEVDGTRDVRQVAITVVARDIARVLDVPVTAVATESTGVTQMRVHPDGSVTDVEIVVALDEPGELSALPTPPPTYDVAAALRAAAAQRGEAPQRGATAMTAAGASSDAPGPVTNDEPVTTPEGTPSDPAVPASDEASVFVVAPPAATGTGATGASAPSGAPGEPKAREWTPPLLPDREPRRLGTAPPGHGGLRRRHPADRGPAGRRLVVARRRRGHRP